jgi:VCBS repeat-containing protein
MLEHLVLVALPFVSRAPPMAERVQEQLDVEPVLSLATREDTALAGAIPARGGDAKRLRFRLKDAPAHGSVDVDKKTGAFRYTPASDFAGGDAFTVEVADGGSARSSFVRVDVRPENDPPQAPAAGLVTLEDNASFTVVQAKDIDGDALSFRVLTPPAHGEVAVDPQSGVVRFTPSRDFNGADVAIIEVSDGSVAVPVSVALEVKAENDAPAVEPLALATQEDSPVEGRVLATDVEKDALRYAVVRAPSHGSLARFDDKTGAFVYVPAADAHGDDAFIIEVSDGAARTESVVTLAVAPVNDAPVVQAPPVATHEDTPAEGAVSASDVDHDKLHFRLASAPAHGQVLLDEDTGRYRYLPAADENGADAFTVEVTDGGATVTANVQVAVAAVPDAPRVHDEVLELDEDHEATARLPGMDPDGDPLAFRIVGEASGPLGTFALVDASTGEVRFTPNADAFGAAELAYEVKAGKDVVRGVFHARVRPVNDAPVAEPLELVTLEDTSVEGRVASRDVDGDALTLEITAPPAAGEVTLLGDGRFRYVPGKDQDRDASFTVVVDDGHATSPPVPVTVHVTPQNDMPVPQPRTFTIDEDSLVIGTLRAVDVDSETLTWTVVRQPLRGSLVLEDEHSGAFTYLPMQNLSGQDSFAVIVSDGALTSEPVNIVIDVKAVDDPPEALPAAFLTSRRSRLTATLEGHDPEGKAVRYRVVQQPTSGSVVMVDDVRGLFAYTANSTTVGTVSFTYAVFDGAQWSAPAEVRITIR